jgi:hypothetical protein
VRPGKLFAANESLFLPASGELKPDIVNRVRATIVSIIQN